MGCLTVEPKKVDICEKIINECRDLIENLGDERVKFVELETHSGYKLSKRVGVFVLTITVLLVEKEDYLGVSAQTCGNSEFERLELPKTDADICRSAYKVVGLGFQTLNREILSLGGLLTAGGR